MQDGNDFLENLDDDHFTANRSSLARFLLSIFGIQDEIALRQQIARSETIISQWNSRLVEITSILSQTLIATKGHQQIVDTIAGIRDGYRAIRIDLGKARREIRVRAKDEQTSEDKQTILQNYLESIEKLKSIGPDMATSVSKNGERIAQMFRDIKLNPGKLMLPENLNQMDSPPAEKQLPNPEEQREE